MKKVWLVLSLFFMFVSFSEAGRRGTTSDYDEKLWRVTVCSGSFVGTLFSSAPVVINSIVIGSPTVNISPSYIAIAPSTSAIGFGDAIFVTTPVFVNTNVNAGSTSPQDIDAKRFNVELGSMSWIMKTGNAYVEILWDFLNINDNSKPSAKIP